MFIDHFTNFALSPWFWLVLTVIFLLIELFTFALVSIWLAISAFVMIFLTFLPIPFLYQIMLFLGLSIVLFFSTRPIAIKKLRVGEEKTNLDSLAGKAVLLLKDIGEFEDGEIKISGIVWSARSEDKSEIKAGTKCEIVRVEGTKIYIKSLGGEI